MNFTNQSISDGCGLVLQPIIKSKPQFKFPQINVALRLFTICCVILGVLSMGMQVAIFIEFHTSIGNIIGYSIWGGAFYLIAGSLRIAAQKWTKSLLMASLVMFALSTAASIVAAILSGIAAILSGFAAALTHYYCYQNNSCQGYAGLEWTLFTLNFLTFVTTIILIVLVSITLYSKKNANSKKPFTFAANGQPIYFKTPSMQQSNQLAQLEPSTLQEIIYSSTKAVTTPL